MDGRKPNFTPRLQQSLATAKIIAAALNFPSVTADHVCIGILELKSGPCKLILESFNIDVSQALSFLKDSLVIVNALQSSPPDPLEIKYSVEVKKCIAVALLLSDRLDHQYVGAEHILIAILKQGDNSLIEYLSYIGVEPQEVINKIKTHFLRDEEIESATYDSRILPSEQAPPTAPPRSSRSSQSPLSLYSINLNAAAQGGDLGPVVGREDEIKEISEILCRKNKNNPILLGEAGVGKTAVVEGLAQQIVSGSCTDFLLNKIIYSLDLASMIAGTKYRGQFEERLKSLVKELASQDNAMLFIDEIHTLVGAGSAEGTMDAANILKPQLARGKLICIGATTQNEYNKTIRKDAALARRFQPLSLGEPNREETLNILSELRKSYQSFHNVIYRRDILELSYDLSEKHFPERKFPDKAIDLFDQAGAKAKIERTNRPKKAIDLENTIEKLFMEEGSARTRREKEAIKRQQELLFEKYKTVLDTWANSRKRCYVKKEHLYSIVSLKTGIPMREINKTYAKKLLSLDETLKKIVIGQDHAIASIHKNLIMNKCGLESGAKPLGSFLLLGSPGLGKTHIAKSIARHFFGGLDQLIHLDMSEFSEKQSASRLIGAAPGYVGYEEGGLLIEKVRSKPYSVVLFDEVEKAHEDVFQLLLQILEEGRLTDNFGRSAVFSNCLIILTANVGSSERDRTSLGFNNSLISEEEEKSQFLKKSKEYFKPEFLDRLDDILVFRNFSDDSYLEIIDIELNKLRNMCAKNKVNIFFDESVSDFLLKKVKEKNSGARPLLKLIKYHIEYQYSIKHLKGKIKSGATVCFKGLKDKVSMKIS